MNLRNKLNKRRRGVIPILFLLGLALIPIAVWFLWQLAQKVNDKI